MLQKATGNLAAIIKHAHSETTCTVKLFTIDIPMLPFVCFLSSKYSISGRNSSKPSLFWDFHYWWGKNLPFYHNCDFWKVRSDTTRGWTPSLLRTASLQQQRALGNESVWYQNWLIRTRKAGRQVYACNSCPIFPIIWKCGQIKHLLGGVQASVLEWFVFLYLLNAEINKVSLNGPRDYVD